MLSKLRTKMTEERGESTAPHIHVPLKKYNAQGLICTVLAHIKRRMVRRRVTASDDLVRRMIVMKHFACSAFYPPRWLDLPESLEKQQHGCRVRFLFLYDWLEKYESLLKLCVWLCLCAAVGVWLSLWVYLNTHSCVHLYVWCLCDVQLHRDEFQVTENVSVTVFQNHFPGNGAHFLLWKL